ncbi:MAG: 3'-5' exonuclease, partial [Rhodoferax sp.]
MYKSKGLEYGVVCLPYAASFRKKNRKRTTFVSLADEHGNRALQLTFDDEALARADRDRLREDLRLLYVALTRARHALWVGFSALKTGNSDACISHESGAGYLLGGAVHLAAGDWLRPLTRFAAGNSHIELQAAQEFVACTSLSQTSGASALQERPDYQANFERNWKIGSFSLLTRDLLAPSSGSAVDSGAGMSVLQLRRPADDEPDTLQPENVAPGSPRARDAASPQEWHQFPKGAEAGNFLHGQLEWLSTEGFDLCGHNTMVQRLKRRCERAGREKHADAVVNWLSAVVQTRLPGPDVALQDLDLVLPEMEFWFPAERIDARALDDHCRSHILPGVDRPALADRQLHGMLMGFADLVFESGGRYWVLDYKSNH